MPPFVRGFPSEIPSGYLKLLKQENAHSHSLRVPHSLEYAQRYACTRGPNPQISEFTDTVSVDMGPSFYSDDIQYFVSAHILRN